MLPSLTKEDISEYQRKAIKYWTSTSDAKFYQGIKKACENKYNGSKHSVTENDLKWFEGLESLFDEYEDNSIKYESIYRADIIENKPNENLSDSELFTVFCNEFSKKKIFEFDDMLCSFSTSKDIAYSIATMNDKYKSKTTPRVLYILKKRISKYLYIADCTEMSMEKEVLKFGQYSFEVVEQNILDNNYVEISIIEI